MKRVKLLTVFFWFIFFCACTTTTKEKIISTNVIVDNSEFYLDMSMKEIESILKNKTINKKSWSKNAICNNIECSYMLTTEEENCSVLDQNAYVSFFINKEYNLSNLEIVWQTEYNQEDILEKLIAIYGANYEKILIDYSYIVETYKWDMKDGISILWIPERTPESGTMLLMVYTDELTAEVDGPEGEPVSVSSNN